MNNMESITIENLTSVLEFLESIDGNSEGHDMSGQENFTACKFEINIVENMLEDLTNDAKNENEIHETRKLCDLADELAPHGYLVLCETSESLNEKEFKAELIKLINGAQ